jgi:Kef-type K+ transport system membrane component KefB
MQRRNYRNLLFYSGVTGFFLIVIFFIVRLGHRLEEGRAVVTPDGGTGWEAIFHPLEANFGQPLTLFLLQIIIILLVSRIFGWFFRLIRQPSVIGEIVAGIVLGPSLTGLFFPELFNSLFPESSLGNLSLLSQIGLILFMFIVGTELDFSHLKNNISGALVISHASIIVPYGLGMGLALYLYSAFAPQHISFLSFSLFLGISMSITAFPVLARIVQETGISRTRLGTMVITCAAIDDVTAWSLLAMVIAIVKAGSLVSSLYTILLSVLYVLVMFKVVRPFLARLGELYPSRENLSKPVVALFFLVVLISSLVTEMIGVHAIFGGFMAGIIMPANERFRSTLVEKVEDVSLLLFLPLFFVYTGLRTEIGLLNEPSLWGVTLLIIGTAVAGKFLGGALSARFTGQGWRDSLMIGTLMNTRGLVELVVLNIGYDLGILDARIFAMLVIMALVTTFMTGPVLELIGKLFKPQPEASQPESVVIPGFKILLSFGNPETGRSLLRLASLINHHESSSILPGGEATRPASPMNSRAPSGPSATPSHGKTVRHHRQAHKARITALHLTPADELFQNDPEMYERESFAPLIEESLRLDEEVTTLFKISNDLEADIIEVANQGGFNLLLIGVGQSVFDGSLLGKALGYTARILNPVHFYSRITRKEISTLPEGITQRTWNIITGTYIPTGVFIDRKVSSFDHIFVYISEREDLTLLRYFPHDHHGAKQSLTLVDPGHLLETVKEGSTPADTWSPERITVPGQFALLHHWPDFSQPQLDHSSLLIVTLEAWSVLAEKREKENLDKPSIFIVAEPDVTQAR